MAIEKKIDLTDAITSVKMPGVDDVEESIEVEIEDPQALEIAKELYNELYVERDHSDMQKYKLEELIEVLGGKPDEYVR